MRASIAQKFSAVLPQVLGRVEVLALFPLLALLAYWAGLEDLGLATALILSVLVALSGLIKPADQGGLVPTALPEDGRTGLVAMLDRVTATDGRDTACLHIQIDNWTALADRLGAPRAAYAMARYGDRIKATLRHGDMAAPIGDGRFGVVLQSGAQTRADARDALSGRIADALSDPMMLDGHTLSVSTSVGHCALLRRATDPAGATYSAAEVALAEAMAQGPGSVIGFAPHMGRARKLAIDLGNGVDAALASGALRAWFQPQIDAATGRVAGMEALARWDHPSHGMLNPDDFIEAVAAAGAMPRLGLAILDDATRALAAWDAAGLSVPTISVNFSAAELREPHFLEAVEKALESQGLTSGRLVVEVLETVAAEHRDDRIIHTLDALREAGHRLDLDNFGIGQASLQAIQDFGIDRLKIDRSFTRGVDDDPQRIKTVRAIVALARELGTEVLAAGVESLEDAARLKALGVTHMQGFVIGRPLPPERVVDWVARRTA